MCQLGEKLQTISKSCKLIVVEVKGGTTRRSTLSTDIGTMGFGDCTWPVRALDHPVIDPCSTVPALKRPCTRLCQTCTRPKCLSVPS